MLERDAAPLSDTVERIVGDLRLDPRAAQHQLGKVAQLAGAPGHGNPAVNDVGGQLGRSLLQNVANGFDYLAQLLAHRLDYVVGAQLGRARQAGDKVAPAHRHHQLLLDRHRRAYADFDVLGGLLPYRQVVGLLYIVGDGVVKFVARALDRGRGDDAAGRYPRHVGRAAADVHHHVPFGLLYRDARADGREHRLFDHVRIFGARADSGLDHRAPLGRGDAGRHAYHHLGFKQLPAAQSFLYKIAQHRLRDAVVGDDAVFELAVGHNLAGGAAYHLFGLGPHGKNPLVNFGNGDHRGLVDDDAAARHKHQRVGGPEVYPELGGKESHVEP